MSSFSSPLEQFEISSYLSGFSLVCTEFINSFHSNYFFMTGLVENNINIVQIILIFVVVRLLNSFIGNKNVFFMFFLVLALLSSFNFISFKDYKVNEYLINLDKNSIITSITSNTVYISQQISYSLIFTIILAFLSVYFITYLLFYDSISLEENYLIPNKRQYISESIYKASVELFTSVLGKDIAIKEFFVKINTLFLFLIISNVQGMIPFMSTITSVLTNTFFIALALFISIIITILDKKGINYFLNLFMPSGCPIALIFLLIPIEVISYTFRVVSLSVRLFANMMAGHTLLKVIVGFS
jgi:F-type H+-transporting ATPase subunit a